MSQNQPPYSTSEFGLIKLLPSCSDSQTIEHNNHSYSTAKDLANTNLNSHEYPNNLHSSDAEPLRELTPNDIDAKQSTDMSNNKLSELNLQTKHTSEAAETLFIKPSVNESKYNAICVENTASEVKMYKNRIRQLEDRLKQKNRLLLEKENELIAATKASSVNQVSRFKLTKEICCQTDQSENRSSHIQSQKFLNAQKVQNRAQNSEQLNLRIWQLESTVESTNKKYQKVEDLLTKRTTEYKQYSLVCENRLQQLQDIINELQEQNIQISEQNNLLRQKFSGVSKELISVNSLHNLAVAHQSQLKITGDTRSERYSFGGIEHPNQNCNTGQHSDQLAQKRHQTKEQLFQQARVKICKRLTDFIDSKFNSLIQRPFQTDEETEQSDSSNCISIYSELQLGGIAKKMEQIWEGSLKQNRGHEKRQDGSEVSPFFNFESKIIESMELLFRLHNEKVKLSLPNLSDKIHTLESPSQQMFKNQTVQTNKDKEHCINHSKDTTPFSLLNQNEPKNQTSNFDSMASEVAGISVALRLKNEQRRERLNRYEKNESERQELKRVKVRQTKVEALTKSPQIGLIREQNSSFMRSPDQQTQELLRKYKISQNNANSTSNVNKTSKITQQNVQPLRNGISTSLMNSDLKFTRDFVKEDTSQAALRNPHMRAFFDSAVPNGKYISGCQEELQCIKLMEDHQQKRKRLAEQRCRSTESLLSGANSQSPCLKAEQQTKSSCMTKQSSLKELITASRTNIFRESFQRQSHARSSSRFKSITPHDSSLQTKQKNKCHQKQILPRNQNTQKPRHQEIGSEKEHCRTSKSTLSNISIKDLITQKCKKLTI